jgi:ATP-binding cassette subfamily B protein
VLSAGDEKLADHARWLWPYVRPRLGALLGVLALASLISLLATAQPYLSKLIIDEGLIGRRFNWLCWLCAAIVVLALAGALLGAWNRWLYVRVSGNILFELRERIYQHLLQLPPAFFRQRPVGDLVTRLDGDVAEIQRFSTDTLLAVVNAVLLLVATGLIMIKLSPLLSIVAAGALPLQLGLRHYARPRMQRTTRAVREQSGSIAQFLMETLGSAKAVQAAAAEGYEVRRLQDLNQGFLSRLLSQQLFTYGVGASSSLLSHLTTAGVFMVGGWQVLHGSLTVGTLVAFTAYFTRTSGSALSLMNLYLAYQRAAVSLARVRELMLETPAQASQAEMPSLRGTAGNAGALQYEAPQTSQLPAAPTLHFEQLTYAPAGAAFPVLKDLDWVIPGGSKCVLFGDSGAGKSTLTDLLRRFADAQAGRILIGGQPLTDFDLAALRRSIVVLDTEPALFRGTVLHNLRYGHFDAPDEAVLQAARRAGVDQFVSQLPAGYSTEVGGAGAGLSTGQRQRIAIARALLGSPCVLVLDEATSNLDAAAVAQLHALIDEHFAQCTRLVISHAPWAVPRADAVFRLEHGAVRPADRALADGL